MRRPPSTAPSRSPSRRATLVALLAAVAIALPAAALALQAPSPGTAPMASAKVPDHPLDHAAPHDHSPVEGVELVPEVAKGFTLQALAPATVPTAITFGPGGEDGPDLYAATLLGTVDRFHLLWTPAGPVLEDQSTYAEGFGQPLGVVFDDAGNLFVSDSRQDTTADRLLGFVVRVDAETGDQTVVVDGVPNGQHNINNLRFGPDGRLYLPNGNPNDHGNGTGTGDTDIFPYSGAFLSVDAQEVTASPAVLHWEDEQGNAIADDDLVDHPRNQDFADKVDVYAHGFRNIYDIAFAPEGLPFAGAAFTGMNGADAPASQDVFYKITPGADHGYPFCYNVGPAGATGQDVQAVQAPDTPNQDITCEDTPDADALLGWHICATGLDIPRDAQEGLPDFSFPEAYRQSAFQGECTPFQAQSVADHTAEQPTTHNTAHKIARVLLDDDGEATEVRDFVTGLVLPTDAHFGPDGALYIADAGMIYRAAPTPAAGAVPQGQGPDVPVAAAGQSFVSPVTVVPVGTTVQWTGGPLGHTVTTSNAQCDPVLSPGACTANDPTNEDEDPDTFNMALPGAGSTASHTFTEAGIYPYFCAIHYQLGMVGTVVVVDPDDSGALSPQGLSKALLDGQGLPAVSSQALDRVLLATG